MRLEHIGIAVSDLKAANLLFEKLLGTCPYRQETVEAEGVTTSFFQTGESKVELLETTRPDGPIGLFLERKGPGIHHLAFEVENLAAETERLVGEGFQPLGDGPRPGAEGKLVRFFHPKTTGGVLVELCQSLPH